MRCDEAAMEKYRVVGPCEVGLKDAKIWQAWALKEFSVAGFLLPFQHKQIHSRYLWVLKNPPSIVATRLSRESNEHTYNWKL